MRKGLLHRRRMMQAGGDGWIYGKRYITLMSTNATIVDDPNYALSPYIPFDKYQVYFKGDSAQDVMKQFRNDTCTDFWAPNSTFRQITLTGTVDNLRINAHIPTIQDLALAYFPPEDFASAYFIYRGANVAPLYNENYNDVLNYYYYTTSKRFEVNIFACCTYKYIPLDPTIVNFHQIQIYGGNSSGVTSRIFEFGENYNYLDYWGFNNNAVRNVNIHTTARYLLLSVKATEIDSTFIRYASTGEYIWKGKNV